MLFSLVSVARKHTIDPEAALRRTIAGFSARVRWIESESRSRNIVPNALSAEELDVLWQEAKEATRV